MREGQDTRYIKIREAAEQVIAAWHDERKGEDKNDENTYN